jgi:hypothetical protein
MPALPEFPAILPNLLIRVYPRSSAVRFCFSISAIFGNFGISGNCFRSRPQNASIYALLSTAAFGIIDRAPQEVQRPLAQAIFEPGISTLKINP